MVQKQRIKKILIYFILLTIITSLYLFVNFHEFINANLSGKEIIIASLLSIGIIITTILLYLIAHQILKIMCEK